MSIRNGLKMFWNVDEMLSCEFFARLLPTNTFYISRIYKKIVLNMVIFLKIFVFKDLKYNLIHRQLTYQHWKLSWFMLIVISIIVCILFFFLLNIQITNILLFSNHIIYSVCIAVLPMCIN